MAALSLFERVDLIRRLFFVVPVRIFVNVAINTYLAWRRNLPIREFQTTALLRSFLSSFTPRQLAVVAPSGSKIYQQWMKAQAKGPEKSVLDLDYAHLSTKLEGGGAYLHWLRPRGKKVSHVVLFSHGGGFNAPLSRGHLNWCFTHVTAFLKTDTPIAVAVLEYGLSPEFFYPNQLRQARNGLEHLIKIGFAPENILIGGDSAGGNLSAALLSHLMHPHPEVAPLHLSKPLAGAFLISPWVTDDTSTVSFIEKGRIDMLDASLIEIGSQNYTSLSVSRGERKLGQGWAWPLAGNAEWWAPLKNVVREVYITAGEEECFRDHIVQYAELVRRATNGSIDVQLELEPAQAHDHILVLCISKPNMSSPARRLNDWMTKALKA